MHQPLHSKKSRLHCGIRDAGVARRDALQRVDAVCLIAEGPLTNYALKTECEQHEAGARERLQASSRPNVEHPFQVIKRPFYKTKASQPQLGKNAAQVSLPFAPSRLTRSHRRLLTAAG